MIQRVFLVRHATSKIREVDAEIRSGPKWTWAIYKRRRYLLGTTAFFTLKAAEMRKRGQLQKIVENRAMAKMFATRAIYESAILQLTSFKHTGSFH